MWWGAIGLGINSGLALGLRTGAAEGEVEDGIVEERVKRMNWVNWVCQLAYKMASYVVDVGGWTWMQLAVAVAGVVVIKLKSWLLYPSLIRA